MLVDAQSLRSLLTCVKRAVEGMDDDDDEMAGTTLSNKAKRGLMLLKVGVTCVAYCL